MADNQFIAVHRGGLLDLQRHRMLAAWAADCAERVLSHFEAIGDDDRPRRAIEVARAWGRGEVATGVAQAVAVAAHRAAREARDPAAAAAALAAGHAAATAHLGNHAPKAVHQALCAVAAAGGDAEAERNWQRARLPEAIRELVITALASRKFQRLERVPARAG
ncbi:MAG TPA: hypothetical protein VF167_00640 [Longimicrobiaceae bacterium]